MPEDSSENPRPSDADNNTTFSDDGAVHTDGVTPVSAEGAAPAPPTKLPESAPDVEPATGTTQPIDETTGQPVETAITPDTASSVAATSVIAGKKSKKKWIIGGVIAAVLVLAGAGSALAYTLYQQPDKVITDSFVNMLKYDGDTQGTATVHLKNNDVEATIDITATNKGDDASGNVAFDITSKNSQQPIKFAASADVVLTKTTAYFKVNDAKKAVSSLVDTYVNQLVEQYKTMQGHTFTQSDIDKVKSEVHAQVDPIINRIDNRWMKADLTSSDSTSNKEQQCVFDTVAKLQSDKEMQNELKDAYQDNRFVTVKKNLGLKSGSYGYVLDIDQAKAKAFGEDAKDSKLGKALSDCGAPFSSSNSSTTEGDDTLKNAQIELWVSQWDHRITGLKFSGEDESAAGNPASFNFDMTLNYEKVDKIDIPSDATDVKDIQSEIESLLGTTSSVV